MVKEIKTAAHRVVCVAAADHGRFPFRKLADLFLVVLGGLLIYQCHEDGHGASVEGWVLLSAGASDLGIQGVANFVKSRFGIK